MRFSDGMLIITCICTMGLKMNMSETGFVLETSCTKVLKGYVFREGSIKGLNAEGPLGVFRNIF